MTTSKAPDIRQWLEGAADGGARWVVIKRDDIQQKQYPLPLIRSEEVIRTMQRGNTEEVYDLALPLEEQLAEARAWHPPEGAS